MSFDDGVDFEGFLIEDVILTLGNVRLSLTWLAAEDDGADGNGGNAVWRRSGIERLDQQLSQLEDRARALRSARRERRSPQLQPEAIADPMTDPKPEAALFRSRRTDGRDGAVNAGAGSDGAARIDRQGAGTERSGV